MSERPAHAKTQDACDIELRDILADYVRKNDRSGDMLLGSCHSADELAAMKKSLNKTGS